MRPKTSVCCSGTRVEFYWRECTTGHHIEAAVEKLMSVLAGPRFVSNEFRDARLRAVFKDRLKLARQGRLTPGDHVKRIQREPDLDLFELRWSVPVVPVDRVSGAYGSEQMLELRLYDLEAGAGWFLGIRAHEKLIFEEDPQATAADQNHHIDCAARYVRECSAANWGVPELHGVSI